MRIHGSCKQSIEHKTQLQKIEKRRIESFQVFSCLKKKSALGFCRLLKDRSLKKWEKHRAHTLSTP